MPEIRYFQTTALPPSYLRNKLQRAIDFYHPGYPGLKPLLTLNASDDGGVDYTVAYYALCIIAGNVWSPSEARQGDQSYAFLSEVMDPVPITVPLDDILRGNHYFFHVPGYNNSNYRYPIYPNFDHWRFPAELPPPWQTLVDNREGDDSDNDEDEDNGDEGPSTRPRRQTRSAARPRSNRPRTEQSHRRSEPPEPGRNQPQPELFREFFRQFPAETCRITGTSIGLHLGHVVPLTTENWFNWNMMREYASNTRSGRNDPFNAPVNLLPIRQDIHHFLDQSYLTLVPKRVERHLLALVTHVLQLPPNGGEASLEMISSYHNLRCLPVNRIPVEYLFARFAWSIFSDSTVLLWTNAAAKEENFNLSLTFIYPRKGPQTKDQVVKGTDYKPRVGTRGTRTFAGSKRNADEAGIDTNTFCDKYLNAKSYNNPFKDPKVLSRSPSSDSSLDRITEDKTITVRDDVSDTFGSSDSGFYDADRYFERKLHEDMQLDMSEDDRPSEGRGPIVLSRSPSYDEYGHLPKRPRLLSRSPSHAGPSKCLSPSQDIQPKPSLSSSMESMEDFESEGSTEASNASFTQSKDKGKGKSKNVVVRRRKDSKYRGRLDRNSGSDLASIRFF